MSAPAAAPSVADQDRMALRFAEFAFAAAATGLSRAHRERATGQLMDNVGLILAGRTSPTAMAVAEVVAGWGGTGSARAAGVLRPLPAPAAALINGTCAHALDFDDTHLPSVLHPSSSVVPAALAVAQETGVSGARLLDAITLGNELNVRLGMAGYDERLGNSQFFERGQHATAICGAPAAALAAGLLYGLDAEGLACAIGIAASMGAGLLEANRTGGTVKRTHCGWAAHSGVVAAQFARAKVTGPLTVLEGRFGFFRAWCDEAADLGAVLRGLGRHWESAAIVVKPYPCNHFTHSAVDAALELRRRGLRAANVDRIEVGLPSPVLRTVAEPAEVKAAPSDGYAAKFSAPYVVATALLGGAGLGVGLDDFTDAAVRRPERIALAGRVSCVADEECDRLFPRSLPAVLRARTTAGQEFEARVPAGRGGLGNPLSAADLAAKFHTNAALALPEARALELAERIAVIGDHGGAEVAALAGMLADLPSITLAILRS
jgi:2-methylcitrate dehydratase PrpD